ncbi:hypothetical protein [Acetobacter senegalensis]|uniref:hypothetical protein n=1 Tax=Acetobacter senegalensis TaxID=446692 RepID=UPI0007778185|nr:hypothetical protein [Acetobacter senegalensis]
MSSFPSLFVHTLWVALVGLCLAALISCVALMIKQGQRIFVLLLLIVLPATASALMLPFLLTGSTFSLSILQGALISPLLSLVLLSRLRNIPSTWTLTAQELGASSQMRLRYLWLPLIRRPLMLSLLLAVILGIAGSVCLLQASSSLSTQGGLF